MITTIVCNNSITEQFLAGECPWASCGGTKTVGAICTGEGNHMVSGSCVDKVCGKSCTFQYQNCHDSYCSSSCTPNCACASTTCIGSTCSDGCGGTCAGTKSCTTPCTNDCTSGAKVCDGNGYKTCGNYDSDSCVEWGGVTSCSSGQTCSDGNCVAIYDCEDSDGGINYEVRGTVTGFEPDFDDIHETSDMSGSDGLIVLSATRAILKINNEEKTVELGKEYDYALGRLRIDSIVFEGVGSSSNVVVIGFVQLTDACDGRQIIEFYCDNNRVEDDDFAVCSNGCKDGACLPEPTFTEECDALIYKVTNPSDIKDDYGNVYSFNWNNNYSWSWYDYRDETKYDVVSYQAGWYSQQGDNYYSPYYTISVFEDGADVNRYLSDRINWQLCKAEEYDEDDGVVYICTYYWRELERNNVRVFWVNENKLIEFDSSYGDEYDEHDILLEQQERLSSFVEKLKDNYYEYVSIQVPYLLERIIKEDLSQCSSELEPTVNPETNETCISQWECKIEPVICPEHGYQTKTCIDYGCGQETKTERIYCSPGICSGCYVPRWIGSRDNRCISYGYRFAQEQSEKEEGILEEGEFVDYKLVVTSETSATLTLISGEKSLSYDLIEGVETEISIPDWQGSISRVTLTPINIVQGDGNGYMQFSVVAERDFNAYCDMDGEIKQQKAKSYDGSWASCQNNFECESNLCSGGDCIEVNDMIVSAKGFKATAVKIFCKFIHSINDEKYGSCVVELLGN